MSDDTSINFFLEKVPLTSQLKAGALRKGGQPIKWDVMLKGPRMGYGTFSIISSPLSNEMQPKYNLDSIFGKKPFTARLLKSRDSKTLAGYYYYELKRPKKGLVFLKLSWVCVNGSKAIRIDCFDNYSRYTVKLDCPK